jgi:hypothetical protein
MTFAISCLLVGLALTVPLSAEACPAGTISCPAWCKKYRLDAASYQVCMYTHPTHSCAVLGATYCARNRDHA